MPCDFSDGTPLLVGFSRTPVVFMVEIVVFLCLVGLKGRKKENHPCEACGFMASIDVRDGSWFSPQSLFSLSGPESC